SSSSPAVGSSAFVRVDQVGYPAAGTKIAYLLSSSEDAGAAFHVVRDGDGSVVLTGAVGGDRGAWNREFSHVDELDFSSLEAAGRYHVDVAGVSSPSFRIGSPRSLYGPLVGKGVRFFRAQRDGPHVVRSVLRRRPSHRHD